MAGTANLLLLFSGSAAGALGAIDEVESGLTRLNATANRMHASLMRAGELLGAALGVAAGIVGIKSVEMAADFDMAMLRVSTGANEPIERIGALSDAILKMSVEVGQKPADLAQALYLVAGASIPAAQQLDTVRFAAEGASMSGAKLTDTTNAVIAVMKAWGDAGMTAHDAMAQINAIVGQGRTTMQDFVGSLTGGVIPTMKALGISLQSYGAAFDFLVDRGFSAETANNRLRTAMIMLSEPTAKASKSLQELGLADEHTAENQATLDDAFKRTGLHLSDLADDVKKPDGIYVAMDHLKTKMQEAGFSADEMNAVIASIFGGSRSAAPMLGISQQLDGVRDKFNALTGQSKNFDQAWEETTHQMKFGLMQFKAALDVAAIKVGEFLGPAIRPALDWLSHQGMDQLNRFGGWFRDTGVPAIREFASWIGNNIVPALAPLAAALVSTIIPALVNFGRTLLDVGRFAWENFGRPLAEVAATVGRPLADAFKFVSDHATILDAVLVALLARFVALKAIGLAEMFIGMATGLERFAKADLGMKALQFLGLKQRVEEAAASTLRMQGIDASAAASKAALAGASDAEAAALERSAAAAAGGIPSYLERSAASDAAAAAAQRDAAAQTEEGAALAGAGSKAGGLSGVLATLRGQFLPLGIAAGAFALQIHAQQQSVEDVTSLYHSQTGAVLRQLNAVSGLTDAQKSLVANELMTAAHTDDLAEKNKHLAAAAELVSGVSKDLEETILHLGTAYQTLGPEADKFRDFGKSLIASGAQAQSAADAYATATPKIVAAHDRLQAFKQQLIESGYATEQTADAAVNRLNPALVKEAAQYDQIRAKLGLTDAQMAQYAQTQIGVISGTSQVVSLLDLASGRVVQIGGAYYAAGSQAAESAAKTRDFGASVLNLPNFKNVQITALGAEYARSTVQGLVNAINAMHDRFVTVGVNIVANVSDTAAAALAGYQGPHQEGGVADRPGYYLVGEGGESEWIIPKHKAGGMEWLLDMMLAGSLGGQATTLSATAAPHSASSDAGGSGVNIGELHLSNIERPSDLVGALSDFAYLNRLARRGMLPAPGAMGAS